MPSKLHISLVALQLLAPAFAAHVGKRGLNDDFAQPKTGQAMDNDNNDLTAPVHGSNSADFSQGSGQKSDSFSGSMSGNNHESSGDSSGTGSSWNGMGGSDSDSGRGGHGSYGGSGKGSSWGGCGFNMGGESHYANDKGEWNFGSLTLTPGGTITYHSNTIVIETQSCSCAIINSQTSSIIPPPSITQDVPGYTSTTAVPSSTVAVETSTATHPAVVSQPPSPSATPCAELTDDDELSAAGCPVTTPSSTENSPVTPTTTPCAEMTDAAQASAAGCPISTTTVVPTPYVTPSGGNSTNPPSPSSPLQQIGNSAVRQVASLLVVAALPLLSFIL